MLCKFFFSEKIILLKRYLVVVWKTDRLKKREIIYLFAKDAYRILLKINQDNWRKMSQLQMMNTDIDLVLLDFIFKIYWENNYCQILLDILSSEYVKYVARYCSILWGESPCKEISELAQLMFIHEVQLSAKQRWLEEISCTHTSNLSFLYTTAIWGQEILYLKVLKF